MSSSRIELVNLRRQYAQIATEIDGAIARVVGGQRFISGPEVADFSNAYAAAIGAAHVIGCSNGTAALSIALEAHGIGRDDEVLTVANTFIATAEAICHVGATPVWIDVDPQTHNIDPALIEAAIGPQTKAIIPVHLFGAPCDMDAILDIARRHNLIVIEDAAQAHLATYRGRMAGTIGHAAGFSFFPGKNLGAYGDAGAIALRDAATAAKVRRLVNHGRIGKYEHDIVGYNQRMDEIQAAVLGVKLKHLTAWTARRRSIARRYRDRFEPAGFRMQKIVAGGESAYHLFVVEVADRDSVMKHMDAKEITTGVHYPIPLHLQPAFQDNGSKPALPVTEYLARRLISLPICGSISDDEVERVCDAFLEVARP